MFFHRKRLNVLLGIGEGLYMSQIARKYHITYSYTWETLNRLTEFGLIQKFSGRRIVQKRPLILTKKGRRIVSSIKQLKLKFKEI